MGERLDNVLPKCRWGITPRSDRRRIFGRSDRYERATTATTISQRCVSLQVQVEIVSEGAQSPQKDSKVE